MLSFRSSFNRILHFTFLMGFLVTSDFVAAQSNFSRGDIDGNTRIEITDPILTLDYSILGRYTPPCLDSADANDDGRVDISDTVFLLGYIFRGTAAPPPPHETCDEDPTEDGLSCEEYDLCPQESSHVTILGSIWDINGDGIAEVVVNVAGQEVVSDGFGNFICRVERGGDHGGWIEIGSLQSSVGRSSNQTSIQINENQDVYRAVLTLLEVDASITLADASEEVNLEIEGNHGEQGLLHIPPHAIPAAGPIGIEVTLLDPTTDEIKGTPGRTLEAEIDPSSENNFSSRGLLKSFGMMEVKIVELNSGEEIHDLNEPAMIQQKVPDALVDSVNDGDTIPMWHFDVEKNLWIEEGLGEVFDNDGTLWTRAEVTHFSWWNWDQLQELTCLFVQLHFPSTWNFTPTVGVEGVNYQGAFAGIPGPNPGQYSLPLPVDPTQNLVSRLVVEDLNGTFYYLEEVSTGNFELTTNPNIAFTYTSPLTGTANYNGNLTGCSEIPPYEVHANNVQIPPAIFISNTCRQNDGTVDLQGNYILFSGSTATFVWTSTGGTFDDPNVANPTFTYTSAGFDPVDVTFTLTDSTGASYSHTTQLYPNDYCPSPFPRGDVNQDGERSVSDAVELLNSLGLKTVEGVSLPETCEDLEPSGAPGYALPCDDQADVNNDGIVDCQDAIDLLDFLFLGEFVISPPGANC